MKVDDTLEARGEGKKKKILLSAPQKPHQKKFHNEAARL